VRTRSGHEELMTDLKIKLRVIDPADGSSVECTFFGRGQDNQDKGINKALVAGVKYGLLKLLMVSTGDDAEDAKNDERTGGGSAPARAKGGQQFKCPECGSPMWDNRDDARATRNGGNRPNFVCKKNREHALFGHHPQEPKEEPPPQQEAAAPAPPAAWASMPKAKLSEAWEAAFPYPQHPLSFAYALVDPKVRDDFTRWTKDDYVRALTNADGRGGVLAMCQGAVDHLSKAKPAAPALIDQLDAFITAAKAAGLPEEDERWMADAGHTLCEPLVQHAMALAQEFEQSALRKRGPAPKKEGTTEQRMAGGGKDDLPY